MIKFRSFRMNCNATLVVLLFFLLCKQSFSQIDTVLVKEITVYPDTVDIGFIEKLWELNRKKAINSDTAIYYKFEYTIYNLDKKEIVEEAHKGIIRAVYKSSKNKISLPKVYYCELKHFVDSMYKANYLESAICYFNADHYFFNSWLVYDKDTWCSHYIAYNTPDNKGFSLCKTMNQAHTNFVSFDSLNYLVADIINYEMNIGNESLNKQKVSETYNFHNNILLLDSVCVKSITTGTEHRKYTMSISRLDKEFLHGTEFRVKRMEWMYSQNIIMKAQKKAINKDFFKMYRKYENFARD